jgi:hypothetical protein
MGARVVDRREDFAREAIIPDAGYGAFDARFLQRRRLPTMSSIFRAFRSRIRSIRSPARAWRLSSPSRCGVKT